MKTVTPKCNQNAQITLYKINRVAAFCLETRQIKKNLLFYIFSNIEQKKPMPPQKCVLRENSFQCGSKIKTFFRIRS